MVKGRTYKQQWRCLISKSVYRYPYSPVHNCNIHQGNLQNFSLKWRHHDVPNIMGSANTSGLDHILGGNLTKYEALYNCKIYTYNSTYITIHTHNKCTYIHICIYTYMYIYICIHVHSSINMPICRTIYIYIYHYIYM